MPVDDRTRFNLHRKLEAALGQEEADTLMAHLPPVTRNQVATTDDLGVLGTTMRSEMHTMGADLRAEMHTMGAELRAEMPTMGTELHVGFANLRTQFVEASNRQLTWTITFAVAWTSILVTLVRFVP